MCFRRKKNVETFSDVKFIHLTVNNKMYDDLEEWAAEDYRSIESQIEYLLNNCLKVREEAKNAPKEPDPTPDKMFVNFWGNKII